MKQYQISQLVTAYVFHQCIYCNTLQIDRNSCAHRITTKLTPKRY